MCVGGEWYSHEFVGTTRSGRIRLREVPPRPSLQSRGRVAGCASLRRSAGYGRLPCASRRSRQIGKLGPSTGLKHADLARKRAALERLRCSAPQRRSARHPPTALLEPMVVSVKRTANAEPALHLSAALHGPALGCSRGVAQVAAQAQRKLPENSGTVLARNSAHPHPRHRPRPRLEDVQPGRSLLIAVRRGQHHAFADAEFHLARRQVGHHHGEFAHQVGGLVG